MGTVQLFDPRANVELDTRGTSPRLDSLNGKVIGLLDNGKANFELFLQDLAELLPKKFGVVKTITRKKPMVGAPAPPDIMADLLEQCDAIVTGIGD